MSVDGVKSFTITRDGCGFGMPDCHFDVFDKEGNKVIRITYKTFHSLAARERGNTDGTVAYYEYLFWDTKQKAEANYFGIGAQQAAEVIVKNNLIVDGRLNPKAVEEFLLIYSEPVRNRYAE